MATPAAQESGQPANETAARRQRVASTLHTVVLLLLLLGVSVMTARSTHQMAQRGRIPTYVLTIGWQWGLCAYVLWGARRRNISFRDLVGGRWKAAEDALLDVAIAAGFWIVAVLVLVGTAVLMKLTGKANLEAAKKSLEFLLPHTNAELALWIALSSTAGFCEEIIFRGYLQRQFGAWLRSPIAGLLLSAVAFGLSHGYEGGRRMMVIAVYGALFGALAMWRRSLRPGMIAHAWHDSLSGVVWRLMNP